MHSEGIYFRLGTKDHDQSLEGYAAPKLPYTLHGESKMAVDRVTLSIPKFKKQDLLEKWRFTDVLFCIALVGANVGVYFAKPFERQFTINDITLSHPFAQVQRVNDAMLVVYSFVVPLAVIIVVSLLFADPSHRYYLLYISVLGLFLSFLSDMIITNYIKNWIGRCRPDFLERCMPREGLEKDVLYGIEVCTTTDTDRLLEGFRTTPSGHSSESFAGLGYLFLWLSGQLLTESPAVGAWRKAVAFIPLMAAAVIALSRTQDYRHHFVDVILGSILGMWIAWWSYRRNFPAIQSYVPFKPLLDNSDVGLLNAPMLPRSVDEEMAPLNTPSVQSRSGTAQV
ncbi:AAL084Wp [Eremothecium gossypii ATCC 10895]|uniref:AAL084Wp n=1 Tax=Eremothecium gossypii (strain ATCC 10895 / CBS 109.51 / FGSC 9923 / NRRL Y-1056) TaxID=284811 RepID=Q75F12_EREGS|nr:AAL084Wp [Eremothecium gossypii ATCC 10895]AAS50282.1 AAL084Wp [Eremothecium gossypii ATCC 10895]AEY94568.1 FAAL084Wp [Eremothecium gossypii FDAG1]